MVQYNTRRRRTVPAHLYEWVDHTLRPIEVSPPAGGFDADDAVALKQCPVCGHAMREHTIVHAAHDSILNCPVPHPGAWDRDAFEPVNEFGMVTHRRPHRPETQ
ncbi:hypothetical protein E3O19_06595 [Cryobacterium algoritolerans]|uniref:Uncharacterized protein n=1 Tax=Cryobacterium algoritolerans TaxID=1259184 RepID=A0A4R8WUL4_9MICO|nr:hypothetical protein [Cryobacterium algoritolerans]TFC16799.1 hypothetical protein E3O19_06595 [Cryobacterium algoritolerans]